MIGKKKNNFFKETVGKSANIEEPMLTKKEQEVFQTKKSNVSSLFDTENVSSFVPETPFLQYKTIKNLKVPIYLSNIHLIRDMQDEKLNEETVICPCGKEHKKKDSLIKPTSMYRSMDKTQIYFEGTGYYHCFECALRACIDQIPYYNNTSPVLNENSKYLLLCLFSYMYPGEKLYPAPRLENINELWNGSYTMINLPGCIITRNMNLHQFVKT